MLNEKQKRILSSVQLQANAPVAKIAEETGYREHTVRYCIDDLKERGVLKVFAFVNPFRLGLTYYSIYFSRTPESKESKERLLGTMATSSRTSWIAEFGGDFQYGVSLYARRITEVDAFFNELSERSPGGRFLDKSFALPVSWTLFRSKFLSTHPSAVESLTIQGSVDEAEVDELDHRILRALADADSASRVKIARALGIAVSTLDYRLRKLERNGVILGYAYWIDSHSCGLQAFILMIYTPTPSPSFTDQLFKFAAAHPNITSFIHCIGSWDYEIRVEVETTREVSEIGRQLRTAFGANISNVKILTYFETLKASTYPFTASPSIG